MYIMVKGMAVGRSVTEIEIKLEDYKYIRHFRLG